MSVPSVPAFFSAIYHSLSTLQYANIDVLKEQIVYQFHVPRIMFLISRISSCKLSMCFSMTSCSLLDASINSFFKSFMSFLVASVRPSQNIPANNDNKVAKGILLTSPFNTSKLSPPLIHTLRPHPHAVALSTAIKRSSFTSNALRPLFQSGIRCELSVLFMYVAVLFRRRSAIALKRFSYTSKYSSRKRDWILEINVIISE